MSTATVCCRTGLRQRKLLPKRVKTLAHGRAEVDCVPSFSMIYIADSDANDHFWRGSEDPEGEFGDPEFPRMKIGNMAPYIVVQGEWISAFPRITETRSLFRHQLFE